MKLTRHNGRAGKNGAYNPKHNDRRFDVGNSEHIDPERAKKNIYWDCYQGFSSELLGEGKPKYSFEDVERIYYFDHYSDHVEAQNERNEKSRHTERNRTVEDLLKNKKTCPEESIYQIGTVDESVSGETLALIATEFFSEIQQRYGEHLHILDWALHVDEGTPHIHERHVFDCENRYGELCPQQEKALEKLGVPLPHPDKPKGKNNNRKQTFDKDCRELLFSICEKHGLHLEHEPSYGGRGYLEKQDYIIEKQKAVLAETEQRIADSEQVIAEKEQQIEEKEQELEELTARITDVEGMVSEVAEKAYEKACEVVSDTVREQTRKEDISTITQYSDWLAKPERKAAPNLREYAVKQFDKVLEKMRAAAQKVAEKVAQSLQEPARKQANVEQVKQTARESLRERLRAGQAEVKRRDEERRNSGTLPHKKKNMELEQASDF